MESSVSYSRIGKVESIHWLASTFLAVILSGCGNFLMSEGAQYPTDVILVSIGYLIFLITMGDFHLLELWVEHKACPDLYPDCFLSRPPGLVPGFTYGLQGGILLFLGQFLASLGWFYDPHGRSVTYLMLAGLPPLASALYFVIFREKLSKIQMIGMAISVVGIVLIGVGKLEGTWISYLCGICSLLCFAARIVIARLMKNKGIDVYSGGIINAIGQVVSGVIYLAILVTVYDFPELLAMNWIFIKDLIAVVLVAYGQYFNFGAVMTGDIAAIVTITNTNGIMLIILEYSFYGNSPNIQCLTACLIIISGAVVLLFGDLIYTIVNSTNNFNTGINLNN